MPSILVLEKIIITVLEKCLNFLFQLLCVPCLWDWQWEVMGITNGTGKETGIKAGLTWEREWEWTVWNQWEGV